MSSNSNGNNNPVLNETQILKLRLHQTLLDYQSMAHALWLVLNQVGKRTIRPSDHIALNSKKWAVTTTPNEDGSITLEAVENKDVQPLRPDGSTYETF